MIDLVVTGASLPDGRTGMDIAIDKGLIVAVGPNLKAKARKAIDADGQLVSPPFIDSHFHMDATLSLGLPRRNESGTLLEGIQLWGELKPHLTVAAIKERAHALARWSMARGTLAIRSHVDICDERLLAVEALLEVKQEIAPWIDLQLVAFPQDGLYRSPGAEQNLLRALDLGVDVVGGIPHYERTMADGARSVSALCEIAEQRGLLIDMHCDETDDPASRHVETLASETHRLGLHGRVAGSHLTSMHSMDNYYAGKLLDLIAEARLTAIANPLINITLQGRHDTYPKRRGMTRVKEMVQRGINVALGHDCVMDPWYSGGSHDMLEVAHMAVHVAQMTGLAEIRAMYDAVTTSAAKVMHLEQYGIAKGCYGDLVILQAYDPIEAIRLRANRLYVIRRGNVIARSDPVVSHLDLNGTTRTVTFTRPV